MPLADPSILIERVLRQHLRPPERLSPAEWAERFSTVPPPTPSPGPFRLSTAPFLAEPLRDFADPDVSRIVLSFATQCGKTTFMLLCLGYTIDVEPYPTLWVTSSADDAREFSKERLTPYVKSVERLARHLSPRAWDTRLEAISLDTLTLYLTGANSAGRLASKPIGRLFLDERDKFPGVMRGRGQTDSGAVELAYKRLGAYEAGGAKAVEACSPTNAHLGIHAEYERSDQAVYHVPCPQCWAWQPLKFGRDGRGGVRWDGGIGRELGEVALAELATAVRRTAWYECAHCAARIAESHKHWMLKRGVWVRAGQGVETVWSDRRDEETKRRRDGVKSTEGVSSRRSRLTPHASPLIVGDAPDTDVRGYTLSRLYSNFSTWGHVAARFVELRGEPDQDFVNGYLGEPWAEPGVAGDAGALLDRADRQRLTVAASGREGPEDFARGTVPDAALVLTGAIDVQKGSVWYEVAGWGANEAKYLIDWGEVPCPEAPADIPPQRASERVLADHWALVAELVERVWPRVAHSALGAGEGLRVKEWVVDSGHRTHEVYRFCQRMGPHVSPIKGQEMQMAPWRETAVQVSSPEGLASSLTLFQCLTGYWKDQVYARLCLDPPSRGAWRFPTDFVAAGGEGLCRHLTSEHRVTRKSGRSLRAVWEKRGGRAENHLWDCAVYNQALVDRMGLSGLTAETADPDRAEPDTGPPGVRRGSARAVTRDE